MSHCHEEVVIDCHPLFLLRHEGPTVMDKGKPRSVVETIGTNIPMLTDEVISDLSGWPEKERPRGFNLSTGYQLTGDI